MTGEHYEGGPAPHVRGVLAHPRVAVPDPYASLKQCVVFCFFFRSHSWHRLQLRKPNPPPPRLRKPRPRNKPRLRNPRPCAEIDRDCTHYRRRKNRLRRRPVSRSKARVAKFISRRNRNRQAGHFGRRRRQTGRGFERLGPQDQCSRPVTGSGHRGQRENNFESLSR